MGPDAQYLRADFHGMGLHLAAIPTRIPDHGVEHELFRTNLCPCAPFCSEPLVYRDKKLLVRPK